MWRVNMASRRYFQVLLQPNRANLIEEIAAEKGIRATELIRRADLRVPGA